MKKIKAFSAVLAVALILNIFLSIPALRVSAANTSRATVLVLDISGSMEGKPLVYLKQSCYKFIDTVMADEGFDNKVAIVAYSDYAYVECDFTDDKNALMNAIGNLDGFSTTNLNDGIVTAGEMLRNSDAAIKNMVVMSDGIPNEGDYSEQGIYTYQDGVFYEYANTVYASAEKYKSFCYIYSLGFFHSIEGEYKHLAVRMMNDIQNAGYYDVEDPAKLEFVFEGIASRIVRDQLTGTYKYEYNGEDREQTYYYDDGYFYKEANEYQSSLATVSLNMAMSAFNSAAATNGGNYSEGCSNVRAFMEELNFEDFEASKTYYEKPTESSIALAAAHKKIKDENDEEYTLIAVAIRGGGYEAEWISNFDIGVGGDHLGFTAAEEYCLDFIKQYIANADYKISGKIKLWITGYSRAAAVSNLLAAEINRNPDIGENIELNPLGVYAYCFECPAGTVDENAKDPFYDNIINIINSADIVTKVAPKNWGFRRYGRDMVLPCSDMLNKKSEVFDGIKKRYEDFDSGNTFVLDQFKFYSLSLPDILEGVVSKGESIVHGDTSSAVYYDFTMNFLTDSLFTRQEFTKELEPFIMEIIRMVNSDNKHAMAFFRDIMLNISLSVFDMAWELSDMFSKGLVNKIGDRVNIKVFDDKSFDENVRNLKNILAGCIEQSAKDNLGVDVKLTDNLDGALKLLVGFLYYDLSGFVTLVNNFDAIKQGHNSEICLAWTQSFDGLFNGEGVSSSDVETGKFKNADYRIIRINCPVNFDIFSESGEYLGGFENGEPKPDSAINGYVDGDGEMVVILPADEGFDIKVEAYDSGNFSVKVDEVLGEAMEISRSVSYLEIPIENGDTFEVDVPSYSEQALNEELSGSSGTEYTLSDQNGEVIPPTADNDLTEGDRVYYDVVVSTESLEQGWAYGSTSAEFGDFIEISASPNTGYEFVGWYDGETSKSTESTYKLCVTDNINLTAKFEKTEEEPPESSAESVPAILDTSSDSSDSTGNSEDMGMTAGFAALGVGFAIMIIAVVAVAVSFGGNQEEFDNDFPAPPVPQKPESKADAGQESKGIPFNQSGYAGVYNAMEKTVYNSKNTERIKVGGINVLDGAYAGAIFPIENGESISIGLSPQLCSIVLDKKFKQVSRLHLTVIFSDEMYYVTDNSTNGTFTSDGKRLNKGVSTPLFAGSVLALGGEAVKIKLI